jgi:hypothetical protein
MSECLPSGVTYCPPQLLEATDSLKCSNVGLIFAVAHIGVEFKDKNFPGNRASFFFHIEGIMVKDT